MEFSVIALKMEPCGTGLIVWVLAYFSGLSAGYPNGKVQEVCDSMIPLHGYSSQLFPKHIIEVNVTQFRPGDHVKVSLSGPAFEGFFLQARSVKNLRGPAVGSFVLSDKMKSQLLTCGHMKRGTRNSTVSFNASDCGNTKFCVRNPSDCDPKTKDCFFLSFKQERSVMLVEMSGPSEGYIAFALSHDQWMGGGDDVYLCISDDHQVGISTATLTGRSYPTFDSQNALEEMSWRLADGLIQCSFRRKIHLSALQGRFNLDADYYIFLADGEVSEDGTIHKHHRQPLITNRRYNVTGPPEDIGGSRSPFIIRAHGALMFVAWMTTVNIGVIVARFFKPVWSHSLWFGEEIWFQVHRMLMMTTVLLTSISFVLPFVYRGGWSQQASFHPYLGCTVMALALIQPLMAAFRPPPQAPRRQIFNWLHWSTGTTARILAVVTMFLGMDLPALNLPDPWDIYTMIGFVAWHVGLDVLLEIHGYCLIHKVEVLEDDRVQILQSLTSVEAQGRTFKKTVLIIYICGNIAFLITFLTRIGQV
ncbi:UNVERIFIED_CONTAM: hypothetical protein K2H54_041543 [Gekko kuhli]